jgi:hypothetical protein
MSKIKDKAIVHFWALRVSTLTTDLARKLESVLDKLPGVETFTITLETQELYISFDQNRLDFETLIREMAGAGCCMRDISAAVLL